MGYYLPFSVASGVIASVGHGLLSTINSTTSTAKWIGYQIIVGFGRGLGMQMTFIAVQNNIPKNLISISTSILTFMQTLGGAVMLSIAQTIFTTSLRSTVPQYAKGVDPQVVINAGATGLQVAISNPTQLAGVRVAYSKSIANVYYLAIGLSCATALFSFGIGWKDIREKPGASKEDQNEELPKDETQVV